MSFQRDGTGFVGTNPLRPRKKARKGKNDAFPAALAAGNEKKDTHPPADRADAHGWVPNRERHVPKNVASALLGTFLADADFALISPQQIEQCAQLYDSDSLVKVVSTVMLNSLLGGGLDIVRPGFFLGTAAKAFYSRVWSRFVRDLMRSMWAFGFAVVSTEPHPVYKAIPHVLRLELLQVRMATDLWNVRHYTVYAKQANGGFGLLGTTAGRQLGMRGTQREGTQDTPIPDLLVFELDPPSPQGQLQSRVQCLVSDIMYYRYLLEIDWYALHRRADPVIVTTKEYKPYDSKNIKSLKESYGAMGEYQALAQMHDPLSLEAQQRREAVLAEVYAANMARRAPPTQVEAPPLPLAAAGGVVHGGAGVWTGFIKRLDIEQGRDVHNPPPAEEPAFLNETRIWLEERVGSLFGVPRSMFSRYSSQNARGEDANRLLFLEASLAWKNEILPILTAVFAKIYAGDFLDDAAQIALSDNIDLSDAMAVCNVSWQLPGVPPPSVITELWREGTLKRGAYLNFISHLYGLPMNAFNAQPVIEVRELAGIQDAPAASEGGEGSEGHKGGGGAGLKPPGPRIVRPPKAKIDGEAAARLMQGNDAQSHE